MKKFIHLFISAMVLSVGVSLSSCGEESDDVITPEQKPVEKVEMGHYKLEFEKIKIYHWSDSQESIDKDCYRSA